jgi:para-aminobenzoate synthetase/4-amino-4-deoxychorismate lyase
MSGPDAAAGVFDTLLVQGGRAVAATTHLDRLVTSVREVYDVPLDHADLTAHVRDAAAGHGLARVRVEFTPGAGVTIATTDIDARPREPWRLVVRRVPGGWGRHKWQDRALLAVSDAEVDPLLVDEHDHVLETGRGNVFVVRDGGVVTPPLDGRILPGVTRATVLDLLSSSHVRISERSVGLADLAAADEVFATNAIGGVRPVVSCAEVGDWPIGPVAGAADEALEKVWAAGDDA